MHPYYLSKLAISWLLYRDDVSPCPRVHQVGFGLLYLVKPKLTAGLVWVLLDLTKGLGFILMWVSLVWFIAGLSKKINGGPFESKSLIALCTYVSSLWVFSLSLLLSFPCSYSLPVFLCLVLGVGRTCNRHCQWYFVVIRNGFLLSLAVHHSSSIRTTALAGQALLEEACIFLLRRKSRCTCLHIQMPTWPGCGVPKCQLWI